MVGSVCIEADGTIVINAKGYEGGGAEEDWRDGSPLYTPAVEPKHPSGAFSVRSLADRWGCSTGLIRNMIARGELRSFRYGNLIRITAEAVAEVEAKRPPPTR